MYARRNKTRNSCRNNLPNSRSIAAIAEPASFILTAPGPLTTFEAVFSLHSGTSHTSSPNRHSAEVRNRRATTLYNIQSNTSTRQPNSNK